MDLNKLGIIVEDDRHKEEKTYIFGSEHQMPIGILLALGSDYNQSMERLCSLCTYTRKANGWADLLVKNNDLMENITILIKKFNDYQEENKVINSMRDYMCRPLGFHIYAEQFAKFLVMITPTYNSGRESVVLECPPNYSDFWDKAEFKEAYTAINKAIETVLEDFIKDANKRGLVINENTLYVEGYKPLSFSYGYGW
jgi:hypothetical protein